MTVTAILRTLAAIAAAGVIVVAILLLVHRRHPAFRPKTLRWVGAAILMVLAALIAALFLA